jgi:hypothetical protein
MRQVSINPAAELELVSGSSLAAVAMAEESTLVITAGVSSGTVDKQAATEIELLTGPQAEAGFIEPTLLEWTIYAENINHTSARFTVVAPTETAGADCQVSFLVVYQKNSVPLPFSTPEQDSPHAATVEFINEEMIGKTGTLAWRWLSGAHSSGIYYDVPGASIIIPGFGDEPTTNTGAL